jgi:hypothetical protein
MKNKMLLVFATIILASTNLSYLGYAFLERWRIWNQTREVWMKEERVWFAGDTNGNTVA